MKVTTAELAAATAPAPVGADGTVRGVTDDDGAEDVDVPAPLVAVAVKVYAVPFVRPLTTHDVAGDVTVHVAPPGDAVTVYDVIGDPPLLAGATTVTLAVSLPGTTYPIEGASGVVRGVTEVVAAVEAPAAFTATTVKLYKVPLVSGEMVAGLLDTEYVSPVVTLVIT